MEVPRTFIRTTATTALLLLFPALASAEYKPAKIISEAEMSILTDGYARSSKQFGHPENGYAAKNQPARKLSRWETVIADDIPLSQNKMEHVTSGAAAGKGSERSDGFAFIEYGGAFPFMPTGGVQMGAPMGGVRGVAPGNYAMPTVHSLTNPYNTGARGNQNVGHLGDPAGPVGLPPRLPQNLPPPPYMSPMPVAGGGGEAAPAAHHHHRRSSRKKLSSEAGVQKRIPVVSEQELAEMMPMPSQPKTTQS